MYLANPHHKQKVNGRGHGVFWPFKREIEMIIFFLLLKWRGGGGERKAKKVQWKSLHLLLRWLNIVGI
jgi:hypothetical protein